MNFPRAKGRIGLIIPPADGREPRECALLYPRIEFVTAGLGIREMSLQGFIEMSGRLIEKARMLASRGVEAISVMGTSLSFYRGKSFNEETCAKIADVTGLPTTSMASAIVRALKANRVSRVALATAYTADLNERLSAFLMENGIETAGIVGLGLRDIDAVRPTSAEAVGRAAEAAFELDTSAGGILISCGGLPTLPLHSTLESRFNIPVVSSLPAGLWDVVQQCGHDPRIAGFGRMFEVDLLTRRDAGVSASEESE